MEIPAGFRFFRWTRRRDGRRGAVLFRESEGRVPGHPHAPATCIRFPLTVETESENQMPLSLPAWSCIPFVTLLACVAVLPLVPAAKAHWERHSVQLGVALLLGVPVAIGMCVHGSGSQVVHAVVEYVQFISLLLSLFVVSGGIYVAGDLKAQPHVNVALLAIGAVLASFIGTTGAAMLLIRPILRTNQQRRLKAHTVIFTIFLVANCGGLLTPLGDPPLFLGLLRGVPFTWTLGLFPQWLFMNGLLLLVYWGLDRKAYAAEADEAIASDNEEVEPIRIQGKPQLLAFALIILAVALAPSIDLDVIHKGGASWAAWVPWRELAMLAAAACSYRLGDRKIRFELNSFSWGPIAEVACLFIGIFLTMVPALAILGEVAPRYPMGPMAMMALTGSLSSVLDNAPTYATFFEMARELKVDGAALVAGVPEIYLKAVSLGAVFGGAVTYIGNGPNFMVKAVAEADGVSMPSFGGYIARWSLAIYVPALLAMACVFISDVLWVRLAGVAIAAVMASFSLVKGVRNRRGGNPAPESPSKASQGR